MEPSPVCEARLRSTMSAADVITTLRPTGAYSLKILRTAGCEKSRLGRTRMSRRPGTCRTTMANAPTTRPSARLLMPNIPDNVIAQKMIATLNSADVKAGKMKRPNE